MSLPHSTKPNSSTNDDLDEEYSPNISTKIFELSIPEDLGGLRLDAALAVIIPEISRSKLTNWIKSGDVLVNNLKAKPKDKIKGGELVLVKAQEESLDASPENIPLDIIFEDDEVMVINKPSGIVVHPGNGNWHGTILNAILYHHKEAKLLPRAGIVHRLDKDTSGLMMIAKTSFAQNNLIAQLQDRSVSRIYRAIVHGTPANHFTINKNIGRDQKTRTKMAVSEYKGKEAITNVRVISSNENFSYVECKLETGRTHQIRVHLKFANYPIVADPVYGSRKINFEEDVIDAITTMNRQALHAIKLSFLHPRSNKLLEFRVPLPHDMQFLLNTLIPSIQDDNCATEDDHNWEIIYAK